MLVQSKKDNNYLTFDEDKHSYTLNGEHVPGVTTFGKGGYPTSIGLTNWEIAQGSLWTAKIIRRLLKNKPKRVFSVSLLDAIARKSKYASKKLAKKSADIGSLVHEYCYQLEMTKVSEELLAKINQHPDKEKIQLGINKFTEWKKTNEDKIVASESIVASITHKYGGKFDRLAIRGGVLILSDFKTSSSIYPDQFIQLGAYTIAIREWLGLEVKGLEILRFGKEDGEFQTLLISKPEEIKMFEEQAVRCAQTYAFRKIENDKRFKWGGKGKKK